MTDRRFDEDLDDSFTTSSLSSTYRGEDLGGTLSGYSTPGNKDDRRIYDLSSGFGGNDTSQNDDYDDDYDDGDDGDDDDGDDEFEDEDQEEVGGGQILALVFVGLLVLGLGGYLAYTMYLEKRQPVDIAALSLGDDPTASSGTTSGAVVVDTEANSGGEPRQMTEAEIDALINDTEEEISPEDITNAASNVESPEAREEAEIAKAVVAASESARIGEQLSGTTTGDLNAGPALQNPSPQTANPPVGDGVSAVAAVSPQDGADRQPIAEQRGAADLDPKPNSQQLPLVPNPLVSSNRDQPEPQQLAEAPQPKVTQHDGAVIRPGDESATQRAEVKPDMKRFGEQARQLVGPGATISKASADSPPQIGLPAKAARAPSPEEDNARIADIPKLGGGDWYVQVSSESSSNSASTVVERLERAGLPAQYHQVEINGKTFYRVLVGPYTQSNAKSVIDAARRASKLSGKAFVRLGKR